MTARTWSEPSDVLAELSRLWDRGALLGATVGDDGLFPLRLPMRGPGPRDLLERWEEVRRWVQRWDLAARDQGLDVEWREQTHRQLGRNRIPVALVLAAAEDAVRLLGKSEEVELYRALVAHTQTAQPLLLSWVRGHPLRALQHADDWSRLLSVVRWFQQHPRPGIYLRQIDLPEVDTKFIEARRGLLAELLDLALTAGQIDVEFAGTPGFERRYGLRCKPPLVRFRLLDPGLAIGGLTDLTVPAVDFARLNSPVRHVFITENEINGLAWPAQSDSLVVFGLGYAVERLAEATWLRRVALHYWGDLDTHGFAILSRLRGLHPHVRSFLMNSDTLLEHRPQWVREDRPFDGALIHLDGEEQALYGALRSGAFGQQVRLEQERIRFGWFMAALNERLRSMEP